MAEQYCTPILDFSLQLVLHRRGFVLGFCVLNVVFSLVTTLGNFVLIHALMKASTIPVNVKKMFLSLAFSDLAVGLLPQAMAAIIHAVILKMVSSGDNLSLHYYFSILLATASFLNVIVIAVDRLLAVSLRLRYQELITPKRVTKVLLLVWLCIIASMYSFLPKGNDKAAVAILLVGYVLTTVAYVRIYKVVKCHQNQIYSQNQLQNAQTRKALRQRKSAYNALFVYLVFLVCYLPFVPTTILYLTNTSNISFLEAQLASGFLVFLNSSLNPLVYCWRYQEIRQILKRTIKQIFHKNENMT